MRITIRTYLLTVLAVFVAMPTVWADDHGYSRIVAFGDSLTDPGNAYVLLGTSAIPPYELVPAAPYDVGGMHFSNGPVWLEQLGAKLGLADSTGPALANPGLHSNYAIGGARARPVGGTDLTTQVSLYLGDFSGRVSRDTLFVIAIGGNDVADAINAMQIDPSGATSSAILAGAVSAVEDNLRLLHRQGARHFLLVNVPNLAYAPFIQLLGPEAMQLAALLSQGFNTMLAGMESSLPFNTATMDLDLLLTKVLAAPLSFGLINVSNSCIIPGVITGAECDTPDGYLYWDGLHPTEAGHAIIAEEAGALLK